MDASSHTLARRSTDQPTFRSHTRHTDPETNQPTDRAARAPLVELQAHAPPQGTHTYKNRKLKIRPTTLSIVMHGCLGWSGEAGVHRTPLDRGGSVGRPPNLLTHVTTPNSPQKNENSTARTTTSRTRTSTPTPLTGKAGSTDTSYVLLLAAVFLFVCVMYVTVECCRWMDGWSRRVHLPNPDTNDPHAFKPYAQTQI